MAGTGSNHPGRHHGRDALSPLRLAVGLGDPERERVLLSVLGASGDVVVTERCLSADQLVASVERGHVDAVLVAFDLHRLSQTKLDDLTQTRMPILLLVPNIDDDAWQSFPGVILPLNADPTAIYQGLLAAVRGERPQRRRDEVSVQPPDPVPAVNKSVTALSVIAICSGPGSPGRTTVALNLATALGAVAPTVLVDADMSGPSVAAALDADPTRNLSMLVHAEPGTPREWDRAIGQEAQPLSPRSPQGVVLCGVPKPEMRGGIPGRFVEQLVAELKQRYRYVVLDAGADLQGPDITIHGTALRLADHILLVASADLIGLWRARGALSVLQKLQIDPERVALIINLHDRKYHHGRAEIEWALGLPAAAVVPHDYRGAQRSLAEQRPLVLDGQSRAGRALLELAQRVHDGSVLLPPEPAEARRAGWRLHVPRSGWRRTARATADQREVRDGDYATPPS